MNTFYRSKILKQHTTMAMSSKHFRILAFIRHYNKLIVSYYDELFANNIYVRDDNLENISFLDRNTDELKQFLDSFLESEDSVVKEITQEFKDKKKEEDKRRKEEESRAKKVRQKTVKSTQKEHARRCKTLLSDIISDTHKRQLFIINHGKELLEAIPSIKEDLRVVLRKPTEEIVEFIKSTVIVEEGDYSRKKGTVTVSQCITVDAILARPED